MPETASVWSAISSAGIGTAIGYVASAAIQARSTRKTKADDAGALVEAATKLTDRLLARNTELSVTNAELRRAMQSLCAAVQVAQDTFTRFPEAGDGTSNRAMMVLLQEALDAANAIDF